MQTTNQYIQLSMHALWMSLCVGLLLSLGVSFKPPWASPLARLVCSPSVLRARPLPFKNLTPQELKVILHVPSIRANHTLVDIRYDVYHKLPFPFSKHFLELPYQRPYSEYALKYQLLFPTSKPVVILDQYGFEEDLRACGTMMSKSRVSAVIDVISLSLCTQNTMDTTM